MDSNGNETTCGSTVCREYEKKTSNPSTTCNNTYKLYKVNTSGKTGSISCSGGKCNTSYYQVKIDGVTDTDNGSNFKGLTVVSAGTKTATYDEKTAWPESDNCTSHLDTFKNSQSGYTCEQAGGAKDIPDGIKKEKMDEKAGEYQTTASNKTGALTGFTSKAKTYESLMEKCQNLFDKTGEGYAGESKTVHDESKYYIINPTVKFKYMQVFLDDNTKKTEWQEINYTESDCKYSFKDEGVEDSKSDGIDVYYSKKFENPEDMRDIKENDKRIITDTELQDKLDKPGEAATVTTKHRRDAQYNAQCTWSGEDIPEVVTLYPGPQVSDVTADHSEQLISGHKFQYSIYLTTYKANYETYWELGNLGGSTRAQEKFVKYFNSDQAQTCASYVGGRDCKDGEHSDTCAYSNGEPESRINEKEDTAKFTCVLQVKFGGMRIGDCEFGISGAEDACDDYDIKEVFEFKVVDPKEMFPGNWDDKANNWKKEDGTFGPTWDTIQNKIAADDTTYAPENLTYSYKLDPAAIKAIKSYNKDHSYSDYNYDVENLTCKCPTEVDKTDCGTIKKPASPECTTDISSKKKWKYTCRECQSNFLEQLSDDNKINSVDLPKTVWNNPVSYYDVRSNNKNWA